MRARSVVDANIHAPRYRATGATAVRQMRVELAGPAAGPAAGGPAGRAGPPLCAINHYRAWTGYVRPGRPVGDGALLDEFEAVDDLRWAEGAGGALDAPARRAL